MIKKFLFPMLFAATFLIPLLEVQADQNEENLAVSIYEPYEEDDDDDDDFFAANDGELYIKKKEGRSII